MPRVTPWQEIFCLISRGKSTRGVRVETNGPGHVELRREHPHGHYYEFLALDPENARRLAVALIVAAEDIEVRRRHPRD